MIRITEDRRKVGGVALGAIYIGNSEDEYMAGVTAIINVAQDLVSTRSWRHGIETMHVGLIDGPGNELSTYCAAVLSLHALLRRHNTLVCCHAGGRSLAVAMMYLRTNSECEWDYLWTVLQERIDETLPVPNEEHHKAFDRIDWQIVKKLMGN